MKLALLPAAFYMGTTTAAFGLSHSPNVFIVYTDEHNFRTLQAYLPLLPEAQRHPWGEQVPLETPNLNFLAEQGVIMNNCYVSTPVSTPSRASFMTGLYAHKTSAQQNNLVLDTTLTTLAQVFKNNGYKTGYAGKWHLSGTAKPGWNPTPDYGWEENDFMINRGHYKSVKDSPLGGTPLLPNSESALVEGYNHMTEFLTDKAIDFISRNEDNPFLFVLSIPDPHGPNVASTAYFNLFKNFEFLKPPTANKNMADYPSWASGKVNLAQNDLRNYWGMVKCIDDNIGRVIDALRDSDLLDNTIVIFTSDHGDMCGEHGRVDKSIPLEASLKVPFIVYAPSLIASDYVVQEAVSNIDVFPTLVDLCGLQGMPEVDGISIAPLLKNENNYLGRNMVFSRSPGGESGWISVTTDRYKLVFSSVSGDKPWLIDKQEDPDELINFYDVDTYQEIRAYLTNNLITYCEENSEPKFLNKKIREDMGVLPVLTEPTTTNFIQNGFFDFGANGWTRSNQDIVFESNSETSITGITCRMPGVNNGRSISQVVEVEPNTHYSFGFKGRVQNAVGASGSQQNNHSNYGVATLKGAVMTQDKSVLLLNLESQKPVTTELTGSFFTPKDVSVLSVVLSKDWNVAYLDEIFMEALSDTGIQQPDPASSLHIQQLDGGFRIIATSHIRFAEVFDLTGRLIKKFHNPGTMVDVAPIQSGMYVTSINLSGGSSLRTKYRVYN